MHAGDSPSPTLWLLPAGDFPPHIICSCWFSSRLLSSLAYCQDLTSITLQALKTLPLTAYLQSLYHSSGHCPCFTLGKYSPQSLRQTKRNLAQTPTIAIVKTLLYLLRPLGRRYVFLNAHGDCQEIHKTLLPFISITSYNNQTPASKHITTICFYQLFIPYDQSFMITVSLNHSFLNAMTIVANLSLGTAYC